VLVDGQTGSAAERLARTLSNTGRATLEGDPTFGKGRAQVSRVLPGGTTVLISIIEMLGPDGRPLQGRGLQPGRRMRVDALPKAGPAPPVADPTRATMSRFRPLRRRLPHRNSRVLEVSHGRLRGP